MNHKREEQFIVMLVSIGCIGLVVESVMLGWEFWVPPLLILGMIVLWWMYIEGKPKENIREISYFGFSCFLTFFHGVHETSFFDVGIVFMLAMVVFSFFNHLYMVNLFLAEYAAIMMIQAVLVSKGNSMEFSVLIFSRILLQPAVVLCVYLCCLRTVKERAENETILRSKEERIEGYDEDMEDFLSNISHELRTPVNVVNGMSDLLIKRAAGDEAYSIKEAGIRLSYQIEDIQDYTESKRNKLFLAEEEYMSTSLVNDVVVSFRAMEGINNLELIVDIDPLVPAKMRGDIKKLHTIFRHLLENAVKFTKTGGIYVKIYAERKEYGVNLCIEVTDTGIGMTRKDISAVSEGMYQVNKKRNRSSGGIGLGFAIIYGFAHRMGGFVKIESERGRGTTVRVTIPQEVTDKTPCLKVDDAFQGDILFHVRSDKFKVAKLRDFYRFMAQNLASGIKVPLYSAETAGEIERLREKLQVSHIFMGVEEYEANRTYFDELSKEGIVITVSAEEGFRLEKGSLINVMPKPLYAYPVIKILNGGMGDEDAGFERMFEEDALNGVKALVVDDEPMNLVVATGLFKDYGMLTDTAGSGPEAIEKFRNNEYDVVFMDHMMPEMDGIEAMKRIRQTASEQGRNVEIVVLTANVVSGAREMFVKAGFDGFIAKPISLPDFERVMMHVLSGHRKTFGGETE